MGQLSKNLMFMVRLVNCGALIGARVVSCSLPFTTLGIEVFSKHPGLIVEALQNRGVSTEVTCEVVRDGDFLHLTFNLLSNMRAGK